MKISDSVFRVTISGSPLAIAIENGTVVLIGQPADQLKHIIAIKE